MEWKPVVPFEPIADDVIPEGPNWIGQIKWDGRSPDLAICEREGLRGVTGQLFGICCPIS